MGPDPTQAWVIQTTKLILTHKRNCLLENRQTKQRKRSFQIQLEQKGQTAWIKNVLPLV